MLKSRGRDTRQITSPTPVQFPNRQQTQQTSRPAAVVPSSTRLTLRTPIAQRAPIAKPEPDYEVVEFPSEQYVNAKLQQPPPPPPRPPTGHPAEAGASCGLCGGGGARVRCAECGRRALCASCDDMYHRHPKRRHHQRQALSLSQVRDERPPLPPKVAPPVPPPRRHKISGDRTSASPRPPSADHRSAAFAANTMMQTPNAPFLPNNHMNTLPSHHGIPAHLQGKLGPVPGAAHLGSMPYLPNMHVAPVAQPQTLGHVASGWARPRNSLPAFNIPPNVQMAVDSWEGAENANVQGWSRPLRRGASVLELGGTVGGAAPGCGGCAGWRYGSCASLDHQQWGWQPPCCGHAPPPHAHMHAPYTPQPYRRADSRTLSRAQSRACSRAASPAMSTRSRTSRRTRHRTPSPPPLPSSDADSESESDADDNRRNSHYPEKTKPQPKVAEPTPEPLPEPDVEDSLGPAPEPPTSSWQCEHCTFVNEPGVRVCVICCRTPTAAPKIIDNTNNARKSIEASRNENARSIAASERAVAETARSIAHLDINDDVTNTSTSPARSNGEIRVQNGTKSKSKPKKERVSSGCGPSPPREVVKKPLNRLITPTRERGAEPIRIRHDIAVGSSPPKEVQLKTVDTSTRTSPYREHVKKETVRHSVSVGPSPPRDNVTDRVSSVVTVQKKSTGTSPSRNNITESRASSASSRANVSNTGTSPPPQSISTQTYEVPSTYERPASPSRSRRRFRDEARRDRSHSRHSLSSDTRESERTSGGGGGGGGGDGRWEWRWGRDSSPGGEWSGSERRRPAARLARRASHLDLRRTRAPARRTNYYGSEAASPERTRAVSMEALAGTNAAAQRGLELAQLMASAEELGFSAAEVQAALAQAPGAPLPWLRERWGGLVAGVAAAVARLEPRAHVSPRDARAALARSRGAMWPAVTDCLDRYRRQANGGGGGGGVGGAAGVSVAARVSGRVWGSPAGAEDDAAPPRRADGSSDEDDDWMYLPLDAPRKSFRDERSWKLPVEPYGAPDAEAELDRSLIATFLSPDPTIDAPFDLGRTPVDFVQSESDFIEAYNALTRSTPLPGVDAGRERALEKGPKRDTYDVYDDDSRSLTENAAHVFTNKNIVTDKKPNIIETVVDGQQHNNIVPTKEIFEAMPADVDLPQLSSLAATLDVVNVINTIGTTDNLKHSLDVTTSQAISYINHVSDDESRRTSLDLSDRIPVTDDDSRRTPLDLSDRKPVTDDDSRRTPLDLSDRIPVTDDDSRRTPLDLSDRIPVTDDSVLSQITPSPSKENNIQLKNNSKNVSRPVKQNDEKLDNLNNIVDTTQKLIQQMKDEINSDINSIDSRNISQSEADSSSNESSDISTERESSYSESEDDETENQTSDDNSSLANKLEKIPLSERRPTLLQRTSSEDNDQFEEAMDHIEEQIQDFKNANIEILDSIARSLQEEHIISVEEVDYRHASQSKRQDQNNNVFVKVNSFEEIYAELNTGTNNTNNTNNSQRDYTQRKDISHEKAEPVINGNSLTHKFNVPKQQIVVSTFQTSAPTKILISETIGTKYNATIQIVDDNVNLTGEVVVDNLNIREEIVDEDLNLREAIVDESLNIAEETFNLTASPRNIVNEGLSLTQEIIHDNMHIPVTSETTLNNPLDNLDQSFPAIDDDEGDEGTEDSEDTENSSDNEPKSPIVNNQEPMINMKQSNNLHDVEEEIPLQSEVINVQNSTDNLNMEDSEKQDHTQNNDNNSNISETESISKESNNNITNKISNSIKSNIPKLIKLVQGNKQKVEKPSPKVIASKVPIRKASLKQYPAPAPPKSHFGHIQSGHVKQLQTRLFNNKLPKTAVNVPTSVEVNPSVKAKTSVAAKLPVDSKTTFDVKPSTSTLNKKKQAPPPPVKESVQISPTQTLVVPKEKKGSYFRESCRTDDDWTDSESEDSEIVRVAKVDEEPERVPSPPPPLTLRRVSGKLIDLAKIQFPEGSPERQARMVLAQGAAETWEQARLAAELAARGAEPAAALLAALECADLAAALAYLHQDCELCASRLPEHEMVSMLRCTHRCCRECARHYFTVQITERSIVDCVCPYCKVPDLEELPEDAWLEYFAHLDILLKTLLDAEVHELFQRKLRDRTLARDPNFRWCMECSSGFFVHPKQKRVRCPECRSQSCAKCRKPWSSNHEGLSCEQYLSWLEDNDPERSVAAVQQHLRENGLECPRCHFKYSLSRGGCMHFTCTQCKYEFCNGCGKPFMMGARCGLSEYCAKLGLHAHHPRNCLFYLRDKEPHQLQTLLQMNDVPYETEAPEGSTNRCPIQLQRETPTGLVDGICGNDVPPKHAGLCKNHYVEYLSRRVRARGVEPLPLLDVADLETLVRRAALRPPPRPYGSLDGLYRRALLQIVKEKIPLE